MKWVYQKYWKNIKNRRFIFFFFNDIMVMVKYMIIGFDAFVNKVLKATGERCKEVVYATYSGKVLIIFFMYMFYTSFSFNMILFSKYRMVFLVLYILVSFFSR